MTWTRFFVIISILLGGGYSVIAKLQRIESRLDAAVTVRQMNRWQKDLKTMNPAINVPNIMDYDSTAMIPTGKGVANAN